MKKVVINRCFGGFGLSHEAILLYAKLKGITLYWDDSKSWTTDYYLVPVEEWEKVDSIRWSNLTFEQKEWKNKNYYYLAGNVKRDDPTLIEVVETLGSKAASASLSQLAIVEIPQGVDWYIHDYDGMESIQENHRSWS